MLVQNQQSDYLRDAMIPMEGGGCVTDAQYSPDTYYTHGHQIALLPKTHLGTCVLVKCSPELDLLNGGRFRQPSGPPRLGSWICSPAG